MTDNKYQRSEFSILLRQIRDELDVLFAEGDITQPGIRRLMTLLKSAHDYVQLIEHSQHEWKTLIDALHLPLFIHDDSYRIVRANQSYADLAGIDVKALPGNPYWEVFPRLDAPTPTCQQATHEHDEREEELTLSDGQIFHVRYYPVRDDERIHTLQTVENITAQRRTEASRRILNRAMEQAADSIVVLDSEGHIRYANSAFAAQFGYRLEEVTGQPISILDAPGEASVAHTGAITGLLRQHGHWSGRVIRRTRDGRKLSLLLSASIIRDEKGDLEGYVGAYQDLSEIEQARAKLHDSEQRLRAMTSAAQDAIIMLDGRGDIVFWNPAASSIFGYSRQAAMGVSVHQLIASESQHGAAEKGWLDFARSGDGPVIGKVLELEAQHQDGHLFPIELSVSSFRINDSWHAVGIARDITQRRQTERELKRLLRALTTLSGCNSILIHAEDEQTMLTAMCDNIVRLGGYRMCWIGFAEEDADRSVRPVASAGAAEEYLNGLRVSWADDALGQGPTGLAIRTGRTQIIQDIQHDPKFAPWHEQAAASGFSSSIALPLIFGAERVVGALNIYSEEQDAFDDDELRLLQELANDLAFGIFMLRTRQERDHYLQEHLKSADRLKAALVSTIQAIAHTVEKRDPYTAGHQVRVADLAAAIAAELKLDASRIEGIQLGAMIHDIGKIYVPAEILNRPGKLTDSEFAIIKSHAQVGYDIMKDVEFPWPVAQMILQHHERLDGSGYPNGLSGDAIILEARILAVADVVEAMAAHRPYRPAVGTDSGLMEIRTHRGTLYDARVVDACLRLFNEKGYTLPDVD